MIFVYAFSNHWSTNISCRTLLELQRQIDKPDIIFQKIYFHPKSFFQKHILNKQYSTIVGLGDFFGNITKIRLETIAHNRYGNRPISANAPFQIRLNTGPLTYNPDINITQNMGNYNCNWIAYQTQTYLTSNHFPTRHLFFHLPKKQPPQIISKYIANFLDLS